MASKGTCASCHGDEGKGSPIGPNLSLGKWHKADGSLESIKHIISIGVAKPFKKYPGIMMPMGGAELSPEDLTDVAAYVWAIGHNK
jgi:mono/diheme cytochrome c family protein